MYTLIFIIISAILLFQITCGSMALKDNARINLLTVSIISIVLNSIASIIGFIQISNDLQEKEISCGMPLVGYMILAICSFIVLFFIIGIQTIVKYLAGKKKKNQ
jgi:hypothetical protein